MMQITEDTPPDMLAGAMDLTVHLPTGRTVKMAVERSTPMMDLLVQITTNHQLQLSGYTLQALGMAPSSEHSDSILPYKPNTPIGALDTQNIRVVPKTRTLPVPKNVAPGHQPFESTFRLKVHLPRNQLYVTRVSRNVLLEDIMKKVCEEKNLDSIKYEFKHPGNLDEVLDPKLTLSDYQITEIYVVAKGTVSLNQAFSSSDIMALRKEEERKQMHNKTGGGVFNLIFRRGKSSMGSGSLSSENRSISPTQSDDSRSVTPPAVQPAIITPAKSDPPKPPQRKRRPAPKPPQTSDSRKNSEEKPPSSITETSGEDLQNKVENNGLTICHSRNSSDSSGYHEASILSDNNCNASLPRRPQSAYINGDVEKLGKHSRSTTNLTQMSHQSKSTSSLAFAGRKKKAAPPPPPVLKTASSVANLATPSPVVASQPSPALLKQQQDTAITNPNPAPRRNRSVAPPLPLPRRSISNSSYENNKTPMFKRISVQSANSSLPDVDNSLEVGDEEPEETVEDYSSFKSNEIEGKTFENDENREASTEGSVIIETCEEEAPSDEKVTENPINLLEIQKSTQLSIFNSVEFRGEEPEPEITTKPEIIALIPKPQSQSSKYDTLSKKRYGKIGTSLLEHHFDPETSSTHSKNSIEDGNKEMSSHNSIASALNAFNFVDEIEDVDENLFTGSMSKKTYKNKKEVFNQLYGIHDIDSDVKRGKRTSGGSLRSVSSLPGFISSNMKKWNNVEELDGISVGSSSALNQWLIGDSSDTESISSSHITQPTPLDSLASNLSSTQEHPQPDPPKIETVETSINQPPTKEEKDKIIDTKPEELKPEPPPPVIEPKTVVLVPEKVLVAKDSTDLHDLDWHYQLPSPPKAFRDSSPAQFNNVVSLNEAESQTQTDYKDSVVTSPELFEKLKAIEDNQSERETISDLQSVVSGEDENKAILNKLSLENLEKRKSLVYNRELATSFKMTDLESKDEKVETFSSSLNKFEETYNEVRRNSSQREETVLRKSSNKTSTLPNFKITTYDNPKQIIKVFEDDTIRSNTESSQVFNATEETRRSSMSKTYVGRSMENISLRKNSLGNQSDDDKKHSKDQEYTFYKPRSSLVSKNFGPTTVGVFRSESFNTDQSWAPNKPVSRSKSHLTLNKYRNEKNLENGESLSKSNSLFDVSGLQSLGVMKLIQNKLNTPTNSMEHLDKAEPSTPKIETPPEPKPVEEKITSTTKTYQYRGPPSINMGTWSDRPKTAVNVKEDPDYKLSNHTASKLIVNTTNNNITSNNSLEVKNNTSTTKINNNFSNNGSYVRVNNNYYDQVDSKNVSIKVNGTEPISTQNTGNVVIKIGNSNQNNNAVDRQWFIKHSTAVGYRKPFGDLNTINSKQRPHSIALDSNFDISRVPVVRSVELKKPYKDFQSNNNTSVTQIYQGNNNFRSHTLNRNSYNNSEPANNFYKSSESLVNVNGYQKSNQQDLVADTRQIGRVNSFIKPAPVVRGFKTSEISNSNNNVNSRVSWNPPPANSYATLPSKPKLSNSFYSTNKDVPFSQHNLRRTESKKLVSEVDDGKSQVNNFVKQRNSFNSLPPSKVEIIQPPPPPQMPKLVKRAPPRQIQPEADPRDALLSAIRNFGGKKGLRTAN